MVSSEYIYGVRVTELPSMTEGLYARIEASKTLLDSLLAEPLESRDWNRITAVVNAISHNTKILNGAV